MTVYYKSDNPNGFVTGKRFSIDAPCVTVMAAGMGGDSLGHWHFVDDGKKDPMTIPKIPSAPPRGRRQLFDRDKPEYRVPLVSEVDKMKWNGLTVATTFAGAGGSSFGYRLAGYRVVWANEFVPMAQQSYRANMRKETVLDGRDIKEIAPKEILDATGLKVGELDIFDGSPPCQAFSTAGKRERGWGTEREYEHGAKQKNEDLFFEYIRIRDGLQPRAFIAENVSGLIKGSAKGYFIEILRELKRGYRVEARLLDAQWLGVPQARQRIIFVGVRDDLGLEPAFPTPLPYRYSVRDAIPWIGRATHDTGGQPQYSGGDITNRPSVTVMSQAGAHHFKVEETVTQNARYDKRLDVTDTPAMTIRARGGNAGRSNEILVQRVTHDSGRKGQPARDITDQPAPTITAGPPRAADGGGPRSHFQVEQISFRGGPGGKKRGRIAADIDDPAHTVTATGYGASAANQTHLVGNSNATHKAKNMRRSVDEPAPTVMARRSSMDIEQTRIVPGDRGNRRRRETGRPHDLDEPIDTVLADGGRKNSAQFMVEIEGANGFNKHKGQGVDRPMPTVQAGRPVSVEMRKIALGETVPDNVAASIEGYAIGREYDRLNPGEASDKFFNLVRADASKPSPTITSQGSGGGEHGGSPGGVASVCHPTEKRKFTIAELRRICAFPDDFVLVGTYGQQWERLGNSVPPVMMQKIAEVVRDKILLPARSSGRSKATPGARDKRRAASPRA